MRNSLLWTGLRTLLCQKCAQCEPGEAGAKPGRSCEPFQECGQRDQAHFAHIPEASFSLSIDAGHSPREQSQSLGNHFGKALTPE